MKAWDPRWQAAAPPCVQFEAGPYRPIPERQGRLARARSIVVQIVLCARAWAGASTWTGLASRALLVLSGLLLLAWVGRPATAAIPTAANLASAAVDAGVAPPPPLSAAPPPPAPSVVTSPPSVAAPSSAGSARARATAEDPVYVNHASTEDLRRLPGVGPKRAEAIVALRQRIGRFQRVEDLLRVKGIGRSTLRKWRPMLRLDAPPAPDAGAQDVRGT